MNAGLLRPAAFLDRPHQNSVAALYAEEFAQLRREVFDHHANDARRMNYNDVGNIKFGNVDRGNVDRGNIDIGIEIEIHVRHLLAFCELGMESHWLSIAADSHADRASR